MNTSRFDRPPRHPSRVHRRLVASLVAFALGALASIVAVTPSEAAVPATIVSLTFDDGNANQIDVAPILAAHGMTGTFYVNSGTIGEDGYLTKQQLADLASAGNEIGGHTVNHPDLATLSAAEVTRQICQDRSTLLDWGYQVRSFAYPFASTSPAIDQAAADCGYNSARNLGDIRSRFGCSDCSYAETIPPEKPFETKALDEVDNTWTLADLETSVTNAESHGGGWVQLTIHEFCGTGCGELSVTSAIFTQFLDWLQPRAATNNTTVSTVGDVIGGAVKPAVAGPPPTSGESVANPGFETQAAGVPTCWQQGGYGDNTATYDTVSPGRTGEAAGRLVVSSYTNGDAELLPSLDLGDCAPAAVPGTAYALSAWYTSTANTQFDVYYRTAVGRWQYWTSGPFVGPSATYAHVEFVTPPVPAGSTGISFGLNLQSVGTLVVDDFAMWNAAAIPVTTATVAPTAADGSDGWYRTAPTVTLSVGAATPVTDTEYSTTDGTWMPYTGPITVPDGVTTLSYRSKWDASHVETTKTIALSVDTVAPVLTAAFDPATRILTATASDATSGVARIESRRGDGAWSTFSSPAAAGDAAATVQFRAVDTAGNVSGTSSVTVTGVTAPPPPHTVLATPDVTVALSARSVTIGKQGTATVTVRSKAGSPSGSVVLIIDGKNVASRALANGRATFTTPTTLKVGTHRVSAKYSGDKTTAAGSSPVTTLRIAKYSSKITLRSTTKSKVKAKKSKVHLVLKVSLPHTSKRPTGTVVVTVGGKTVKRVALTSKMKGTVRVTLPVFPKKGKYSVKARFGATKQIAGSTSASKRIRVVSR